MAKRKCTGTTRKGAPCKAAPLHGRDVCMAHADEKTRESVGFVARNGKQGRPRNPRAVEIVRERLEAGIDDWWQVLDDARSAQRGLVVGDGEAARVEYVDDHGTRLKAFREVFDRSYGKPMQMVDITSRIDESDVDSEIRKLLSEMDRRHGPAHANGNGKIAA